MFRLDGPPFWLLCVFGAVACAGNAQPADDTPVPCAVGVFAKSCAETGNCHAPPNSPAAGDLPALAGFDLSPDGIKAADNGAAFVGRKASDDAAGLCGAGAKPPVMGKLIVDPNDPEASLLYDKLSAVPSCGLHMPLIGKPATLSTGDQKCILDWIESLPGVHAGGSSTSDASSK